MSKISKFIEWAIDYIKQNQLEDFVLKYYLLYVHETYKYTLTNNEKLILVSFLQKNCVRMGYVETSVGLSNCFYGLLL